ILNKLNSASPPTPAVTVLRGSRGDAVLSWPLILILIVLVLGGASPAGAQQSDAKAQEQSPTAAPKTDADSDVPPVMFPHLATDRLWLSGQANFISQWHPEF